MNSREAEERLQYMLKRCDADGYCKYYTKEKGCDGCCEAVRIAVSGLEQEEESFPVIGGGAIPWKFIEPHEPWAIKNHGQTLERLAQRGGMSWGEILAVLSHKKDLEDDIDERAASFAVLEEVEKFRSKQQRRWIPITERVPEDDRYIILSFANYPLPTVGRYEKDDQGGAFYEGDYDKPLNTYGLFVNAWAEMPEQYREEENG